jgi:DUF4097 and DUF4098 domain-containing protein YvlB
MNKGMRILAMWILVAAPATALASTPIDETKAAPADGVVSIENMNGTVIVEGWNQKQVEVTGTLGDGPERLEFEVRGKRTTVEVVWPDHDGDNWWNGHRKMDPTELRVRVPRGSDLRIEGVNLGIDITAVDGEIELETVNGDIKVSDSPASVSASTVNGSIESDATTDQIEVEAVNGELTIRGAAGDLSASTVNGPIRITGDLFRSVDASTVSGDIFFDGKLDGEGSFDFESHSGDIELRLPKTVSAEFDVSTFSGAIHNAFGPEARRKDRYAPGMELSFSTGDGAARVDISSFSGKVQIEER